MDNVRMSGPILDGRGPEIVRRNTREMESQVADEGLRRVHQRLGQVLKHPTGYYESRVVKTTRSSGYDVDDSRVVYGPWLEGVSSRNDSTRFKGYHTFQMVGQQLEADTPRIVQEQTRRMIGELGGN
jgi:hypothetical protein